MGSFGDQLRQFAEQSKENAVLVVKKVGIDMLASVVDGSPVGDPDLWKSKPPEGYVGGRFRANWQVGIGRPAAGEIDAVDDSGSATKAAGMNVVMQFGEGDSAIFITNNLPYAIPLEYGHSTQAPGGMVRVTVAKFQGFVEQAAAEARA